MIDPDGKKSKISIVDLRNLINQLPEESEMVMEIRAMSARSSGKIEEAARLLYRAWKVKGTRVELLREIANLYSIRISPDSRMRRSYREVYSLK